MRLTQQRHQQRYRSLVVVVVVVVEKAKSRATMTTGKQKGRTTGGNEGRKESANWLIKMDAKEMNRNGIGGCISTADRSRLEILKKMIILDPPRRGGG